MKKKKNILISSNASSIAKILSNCLVSHNTSFINDKDLIYSNPKELEKLFEKIDVFDYLVIGIAHKLENIGTAEVE